MSAGTRSWPVPVALVALSAIPLTAGTLRLIQLAGGPAVIPADHRFASFPIPVVVHRRHPAWHRRAGRVVVVAGLLAAISALWMTLFHEAQPGTGDLLYVIRLVFGPALAGCLVLGLAADLAKGAGWAINLAVAEWAIRRPTRRRPTLSTGSRHAGALS